MHIAPRLADRLSVLADQADRAVWLDARRSGLGGSDMAAICGESKYRTAIDVWTDRMEPQNSEPTNSLLQPGAADRLSMGHILEPVVMSEAAAGRWSTDRRIRMIWRPPLVASKEFPWHIGSADGLSISVRDHAQAVYVPLCGAFENLEPPGGGAWEVIEECKTHGARGFAEYADRGGDDEDPVPADKMIQCAWYAGLWGVSRVALSAVFDTHIQKGWQWVVDPEYIASLRTIAEDWWRKHIIEGLRPDPDGSERYTEYLSRKFAGQIEDTLAIAGPELDAVVVQLAAQRAAVKAAEVEQERLEQLVKGSMGGATRLKTSVGYISWRPQKGRVHLREAINTVYAAAGWDASTIIEHENKHRGDAPRPFLFPRSK